MLQQQKHILSPLWGPEVQSQGVSGQVPSGGSVVGAGGAPASLPSLGCVGNPSHPTSLLVSLSGWDTGDTWHSTQLKAPSIGDSPRWHETWRPMCLPCGRAPALPLLAFPEPRTGGRELCTLAGSAPTLHGWRILPAPQPLLLGWTTSTPTTSQGGQRQQHLPAGVEVPWPGTSPGTQGSLAPGGGPGRPGSRGLAREPWPWDVGWTGTGSLAVQIPLPMDVRPGRVRKQAQGPGSSAADKGPQRRAELSTRTPRGRAHSRTPSGRKAPPLLPARPLSQDGNCPFLPGGPEVTGDSSLRSRW